MIRSLTLGGLTVGVPGHFDSSGNEWILTGLNGWDAGGVSVRREVLDRPSNHGAFAVRGWRGGRLISVRGEILCPDRQRAADAVSALAALLADGALAEVSVSDVTTPALTAMVALADAPSVSWRHHRVTFGLDLWAPNPLRYGPPVTVSTGFPVQSGGLEYDLYTDGAGTDLGYLDYGEAPDTGVVTLTNEGTADAWPIFEVTGPVPDEGFELVEVGTGRRVVFAGAVAAGSSLVLDSAQGAGSAVIDGTAERGGSLTVLEWFPAPAGGSTQVAFLPLGASSAASLSVSFSPAWW